MKFILMLLSWGILLSAPPKAPSNIRTNLPAECSISLKEFEEILKRAQQKALEQSSAVFITLSKKQIGWESATHRANELGYRIIQSPVKVRIIVVPSK